MSAIIIVMLTLFVFPNYSDSGTRTHVFEGLILASAAKNLVADNAAQGLPLSQGWKGIHSTQKTASILINTQTGVITIIGTQHVDHMVLILTPQANGHALVAGVRVKDDIEWTCSEPTGRVAQHDLPLECRDRESKKR